MRLRFSWLLISCACSETPILPIEVSERELALVVSTRGGETHVELRDESALRFEADEGRPVFAFRLRADDYRSPDGRPLTRDELRNVSVGLAGANETAGEGAGACGRCLALARTPPHRFFSGDACPLPVFERGASFFRTGDGYRCAGAAGSLLCTEGTAPESAAIEDTRRMIRLRWPGPCACEATTPAPSLSGLRVRGVLPAQAPLPLSAFARLEDGRIAAFSEAGHALLDPDRSTGEAPVLTWADPPRSTRVQNVIALDSGGVLAFGQEFNSGLAEDWGFLRFAVDGGVLGPPVRLSPGTRIRAADAVYLARNQEFPLYLLGATETAGGTVPAAAACTEGLRCVDVPLGACDDPPGRHRLREIAIFEGGAGVAVSGRALYLKAPRPPPEPNPSPEDVWACVQPAGPFVGADGSAPASVTGYRNVGRIGDRAFICASSTTPDCGDEVALVLTTTVSVAPGELPKTDLAIVYRSPPDSECRGFIESPGQEDRLRLLLSTGRWVNFDAGGRAVEEGTLTDALGNAVSVKMLTRLEGGYAAFQSAAHRVFLTTPEGRLERLYGNAAPETADFRAIVAVDDRRFWAFGDGDGVWEIVTDPAGAPPSATRIPDPQGVLEPLEIRAAVASGLNDGRVLAGGRRTNGAFIVELEVTDRVTLTRILELPADVADSSIEHLARVGPGRFVAASEGSRLLSIEGDSVSLVEIDWDDPSTEAVERLPPPEPERCPTEVARKNAFLALFGSPGVAWAAGEDGIVVRVVGTRGERFSVPDFVTLSAARASCPDIAAFGGVGRTSGGVENTFLRLYALTATPESSDPRQLAMIEVGRLELEALQEGALNDGIPVGIVKDAVDPDKPEFAVVHRNGFLVRPFSTEAIEYIRAPFEPEAVVQAPSGVILYGSSEGRLAIGTLSP